MTEQIASLRDLEEWWSIGDLYDANDALDAIAEARNEAERRAAEKGGR